MADPSGDKYAQVIGDGQQTVTLAGAFLELVRPSLSSFWRKRSAAQTLKQKLGEWADEAIDDKGRWMQPILRSGAFVDHLVSENGYFQPTGRCESSFAWAQLLFALNIRPKGGVLAFRLPPRELDPAVSSDISLEVDGEVMCHIINLYRLYSDAAPWDFSWDHFPFESPSLDSSPEQSGDCYFPFGRFSVEQVGKQFVATFEPGSKDDLSSQRVPLDCYITHIRKHLHFERGAVIAKYFNAIYYQISDLAVIGDLPNPGDPMKKRANYYLRSMKILRSKHECDDSCEKLCSERNDPDHVCVDSCKENCHRWGDIDWRNPKLVSRIWVEEASRIKRRVTTKGGENMGLVDYIIASLHDRPDFVSKAEDYRKANNVETWEESVRYCLAAEGVMSSERQVEVFWSNRMISEGPRGRLWIHAKAELPSIIESLAKKPRGSWLHELSGMVPEVLEMISIPHKLQNVPVIVLELGQDHGLWNGTCEIKGQLITAVHKERRLRRGEFGGVQIPFTINTSYMEPLTN